MPQQGDEFHTLGVPLAGGVPLGNLARRTLTACGEDARFSVLEVRELPGPESADIIVAECRNDGVPTKNKVGIGYVERLALVFWRDKSRLPETYALRKAFPVTEHQNASPPGFPCALCLYFEPWTAISRTWTARKHLQRVARWLADVAAGELHRANQPVEQLYFEAPWELILPAEVREAGVPADHVLSVRRVTDGDSSKGQLIATLARRGASYLATPVSPIFLTVDPVVGGAIEHPPATLGELADQLARRRTDLIHPLVEAIDRLVDETGVACSDKELGLLVVRVPISREAGGTPERFQIQGFLLEKGIGLVGEAMGLLRREGAKYHRAVVIGGDRYAVGDAWKAQQTSPLAVIDDLSPRRVRELTGVDLKSADFEGVLIGAGSLGSQLADIWSRERWGNWAVIDHDRIKPHNIPRHRALHGNIGETKAELVVAMMSAHLPAGMTRVRAIVGEARVNDPEMFAALKAGNLIVDASTTLHVPRDLASRAELPRVASTFFTPSGQDCVLLLEDAQRESKIDALEAQYYRAIIRNPWGENHLTGHLANTLWVGAGCREVTTVLAPELVALHGGLLARRLRRQRDIGGAHIGIWQHDEVSGSVTAHSVPVAKSLSTTAGHWRVLWDEAARATARTQRHASLPRETGGVLVGYVDQMSKTVVIVDVLSAPADSFEASASFLRGVDGLREKIEKIAQQTGGVVGYVGEWHSHPDGCSTLPSYDDIGQLTFVTAHLRDDGLPAVMLIIGADEERFVVGEMSP